MNARKRLLILTVAVAGAVAGAGVIQGMAQVITDPTGSSCVDTGTQGCSAQYLAVSEGGNATATSSLRGYAVSGTGNASVQDGAAISGEGSATNAGGGSVISGTGNATCGYCGYAVSGTGNAASTTAADPSNYGWKSVAISGTGCASGGSFVTVVLAGSCDADSYEWNSLCNPVFGGCLQEDGSTAINLGHGCARGGSNLSLALWGCADGTTYWPGYGWAAASVFGPASGGLLATISGTGSAAGTSATCEGLDIVVSAASTASCPAGSSSSLTNVVIGSQGASNGGIAIAGTGPATSSGLIAVSGQGSSTAASGGELAVSGTGYAKACGGPEPIAFSAGALISYPGAGATTAC